MQEAPVRCPPATLPQPCTIHTDCSTCPSHATPTPTPLCPFYKTRGSQKPNLPGLCSSCRRSPVAGPDQSSDLCWRTQNTRTKRFQLRPHTESTHTPCILVVFGATPRTSPRARCEMHQVCQNPASCPLPARTGQTCLHLRVTAKRGGMGKSRQ